MTDPITRLNAALEGRYRIERELGEGGMATVYLADDLKHERKVALKVLKPELAAVVGADRFLAEIKTTANLQHPHILPLFDSGEADGLLFYVMPYVEGETLRDRLDREHQLPVDDAIRIATNVAEALDYAHRRGVIHRDIKPANVLLQDGKPVVSDFGIALAVGSAGGGRLTETGLSLGTPHYMSPEQATGDQNVGPAADIYALGCVLYEMLVGEPPFTGSTPQAVLGRIITGEADRVTDHRRTVPSNVEGVIARSLEKVPADRFGDAAGLIQALSDEAFRYGGAAASGIDPNAGRWRALTFVLAFLLAVAIAVAGSAMSGGGETQGRSVAVEFAPDVSGIEISANGSTLLGWTEDGWALRTVDGLGWRALYQDDESLTTRVGSAGGSVPTLSPDGRQVAYASVFGGRSRSIYRLALDGGAPELMAVGTSIAGAIHWAEDDALYYSTGDRLIRITPSGGDPEEVFVLPAEQSDALFFPHVLPGGTGVLFQGRPREGGGGGVMVGDLRSGTVRELAAQGSRPKYAASGHVLYLVQGTLVALPFDPEELRPLGSAVTMRSDLPSSPDFSVSADGTLVYARRSGAARLDGGFVWAAESGEMTPTPPETSGGTQPRVSPDGREVAYRLDDDIWILDLGSGVSRQFTFEGVNVSPIWSPDGEWLYFLSARDGTDGLDGFRKRSDGTGAAEALWRFSDEQALTSASSDGRWLVLHTMTVGGVVHAFDLSGGEGTVPEPYLPEDHAESVYEGALSPDGRWLAYVENVDGLQTVYARGFPEPSGQWRLSSSASSGHDPVWAPDGSAIYYGDLSSIFRTEVTERDGVLVPGATTVAFRIAIPGGPGMDIDIHPAGDRIIVTDRSSRGNLRNVLVTNFFDELERRAPPR